MTEPKKYRTDWTIEEVAMDRVWPDDRNIKWYKGTPDMDNVHYCSTVEEAEREIDDAIILEQEQVIDRFRDALRKSTDMLSGGLFHPGDMHLMRRRVAENEQLIKAFQS